MAFNAFFVGVITKNISEGIWITMKTGRNGGGLAEELIEIGL